MDRERREHDRDDTLNVNVTININVNSKTDDERPPSWARDIANVVRGVAVELGLVRNTVGQAMADIDDKLDRLEASQAKMGTAIQGLGGDLTRNTEEITKLKDELANAGGLSAEQKERFERLIGVNEAPATTLEQLDALNKDPNAPTPELPSEQTDPASDPDGLGNAPEGGASGGAQ